MITRRNFLRSATHCVAIGALGCASIAAKNSADIRIEEVSFNFEDFVFRAPVGFAGTVMDRATLITVQVHVRTRAGKVGTGFGTIPFNHTFSYPSRHLSNAQKNDAMKALAMEIANVTRAFTEYGHPLELNFELAPQYFKAAADLSQRLNLADPIPRLCTLVTAAAFDAAIYDAYGKTHRRNAFDTLNAGFMNYDLARYLGHGFTATYPNKYLLPRAKPRMILCHLVSAVDPLETADNTRPLRDGLPETLEGWIDYNGLLELKIKLNGTDLKWDLDRVLRINRVTERAQTKRGVQEWAYVLDFNEKCPHVDYFLKFCRELKQRMPVGFRRIKYTEQPTSRDLKAHPENAMHEAAKLCPVVIDESLVDVESLRFARELGWTGAAVKSPKGLTQMILVACAAAKDGTFLCGGDMSCPGAALIQTANLQARVPTITSVEANARQYLPAANRPWENKFPGMFGAHNGILQTSEVAGPGLGVPNAA